MNKILNGTMSIPSSLELPIFKHHMSHSHTILNIQFLTNVRNDPKVIGHQNPQDTKPIPEGINVQNGLSMIDRPYPLSCS